MKFCRFVGHLNQARNQTFFVRDLKHKYSKTVGDAILHEMGATGNAYQTLFGTLQGKYASMVGLWYEKFQINRIKITKF
jgi:hypothetical protein